MWKGSYVPCNEIIVEDIKTHLCVPNAEITERTDEKIVITLPYEDMPITFICSISESNGGKYISNIEVE
jgi:hypothetical protein